MAGSMTSCPWEKIEGFSSHSEFVRFCDWMKDLIVEGGAKKIPVQRRYRDIESLSEEWFEHVASATRWRLVHPDGPFRGLFERVV
jgi:hypothetical protein